MISLLAVLLVLGSWGAKQPEVSESDILWLDSEKTTPLFIPEGLLKDGAERRLEQLRIPRPRREAIQAAAARALASGSRPDRKCARPPEGDPPGLTGGAQAPPSEEALPALLAIIKRTNVSFLGEVTDLTPGWVSGAGYIGTLVEVHVREIFKDSQGNLYEGKVVTYLQQSGALRLGERYFCTENPPNIPVKLGEKIIVSGYYEAANPSNIGTSDSIVFHVDEGVAYPAARSGIHATSGLTLLEIRRFAERLGVAK